MLGLLDSARHPSAWAALSDQASKPAGSRPALAARGLDGDSACQGTICVDMSWFRENQLASAASIQLSRRSRRGWEPRNRTPPEGTLVLAGGMIQPLGAGYAVEAPLGLHQYENMRQRDGFTKAAERGIVDRAVGVRPGM